MPPEGPNIAVETLTQSDYALALDTMGALAGPRVVIVPIDSRMVPTRRDRRLPPGVIAIGYAESPREVDAELFDVLLTTEADAPGPWVATDDVERTVGEIGEAVTAAPEAALVLAQVLRATAELPVAPALLVESLAYSTLQHGATFVAWLEQHERNPTGAAAPADPVRLTRAGAHLDIVLERPDVHNAFDAAMRDSLCDAFDLVALDRSIAAVDLRGAGPSFCSGGDLTEFGQTRDAARAHLIRTTRSVGRRIHDVAPRVTAHLHGACIGAGIELAAFAGTVLADATARIRLPEVAMGLIPGAGGTVSLPRRIGRHRTAYLALTGTTLDTARAAAWGLVDHLVV